MEVNAFYFNNVQFIFFGLIKTLLSPLARSQQGKLCHIFTPSILDISALILLLKKHLGSWLLARHTLEKP